MAISKETKEFIENLIQYYTNEISSYKQIAENFIPEIESISDTTFGIIVGNVYSEFMKTYQNQKKTPDLEDIQEFNEIMKDSASLIKKAILEKPEVKGKEKSENKTPEYEFDVEN